MKKSMIIAMSVSAILLGGCAAKVEKPVPVKIEPVKVEQPKLAKKERLNVKKTVSNLLDYCEDWAEAFNVNLGKNPEEAFYECIQLTSENMKEQADERFRSDETPLSARDFPFTSGD